MSKVYVFLADGFEEIEGLTIVDLLRRAEIDTTMISVSDTVEVMGGHGIVVSADKVFEEASFEDVDMLVLPGGLTGVKNLAKHEALCDKLREFHEEDKLICAICAAPTLLNELQLLEGKKLTSYRDFKDSFVDSTYIDEKVVKDGNLITSQGLGTAIDFGLAIVEHFKGKKVAEELQYTVMYRR